MKKIIIALLALPLIALQGVDAKVYTVKSPSGVLEVAVDVAEKTTYTLSVNGEQVLAPSRIAMELECGAVLGDNMRVR